MLMILNISQLINIFTPRISTCTDTITGDTNVPTKDDKYPLLDPDDKRRHMTGAEILPLRLNLDDSLLDDKGKEEFLTKTDDFNDIFNLRDEIGTHHLLTKGTHLGSPTD